MVEKVKNIENQNVENQNVENQNVENLDDTKNKIISIKQVEIIIL